MVEKLGYQARAVETGLDVLGELGKETFDLILMDIQMPLMNGEEATVRIRQGEIGDQNIKIPIIAVTAYAAVGDRERFLAAGMDEYIPKPVDIGELHDIIEKVIS